ncbi:MAG: LPS export ABC transporter periplasmic protein LptC, partial [Thiothrix sp.]
DYLSKTDLRRLAMEKDQIDYYLTDFSLMAVANDGTVSYEIDGQHLRHWQGKKQSQIVAPEIKTNQGLLLRTSHLLYDQNTQTVSTDAVVTITTPSGTLQSTGLTAKLDQDLLRLENNVRSTYQVK